MKRILFLWLVLLFPLYGISGTKQEHFSLSSDKIPVRAYVENGKLNFSTSDGAFKWWFDNRIYLDAAAYFPSVNIDGLRSKPNKDLETDDGEFRFNNGVQVRRARFAIKATLYDKWFAEFDLDFAYNEVSIKDMYVGYKFNDFWQIKAGNFKEPMSMERTTSSKYLLANERPMAVDMFAAGRRLGVAATGWGNHWWAAGGVFGPKVDILQKEKNRGSDGYGFTGRAAVSPVAGESMTVHIGGYATYRTPDPSGTKDRLVEFRTFPESEVDRRRFVRAEISNVNHYYTLGYELGFRYRKFLVYGEYLFTSVNRYQYVDNMKSSLKNAVFNGWYVSGSYMILGQNRQYSPDEAEFGPMNVSRKGGNLELAARFSRVNLNDFHDSRAYITGGKADSYSVSLNWYPRRGLLVGLNYLYLNQDKYADDKGHITYLGKPLSESFQSGVDFSVLQLRIMASF